MSFLTGTPKIDTLSLPYASVGSPMQVEWEDESDYKEMLDGEKRLAGAKRLRGRFEFGYDTLDAGVFASLIELLEQDRFSFTVRQKASSDPAGYTPVVFACRCVSPIPSIVRLTADRTYPIEIELETVGTYDHVPNETRLYDPQQFSSYDDSAEVDGHHIFLDWLAPAYGRDPEWYRLERQDTGVYQLVANVVGTDYEFVSQAASGGWEYFRLRSEQDAGAVVSDWVYFSFQIP